MAPTQTGFDWETLAKSLGVSVSEAHNEAATTASQLGIALDQAGAVMLSEGGANPSQAGLRQGAEQKYGFSAKEWAGLSPSEKAQEVKSYVESPDTPFMSAGTVKGVDQAAAHPSAGPAAAATPPANETKAIEQQLSTGPWAEMSKSLVAQYKQEQAPVQAAVSGATGDQSQAAAANSALASLGLSTGSGAAQWLESNLKAANETAAPVDAAMGAYGSQYAAEAGPITKALNAYGQANELSVAYAPEQAWLNALSSHVTSNLSYYGQIPTAAAASLTPGVVQALQQSGGYPGSTGSGLEPLSALAVKNGQVTMPKASGATTASAATAGGSVPGAATNAGTG